MSDARTVVRYPLPPVGRGGFRCPTCGATTGITVALDMEDTSPEPSYMQCGAGHFWPEPVFPRALGAGMLRRAVELDPEFLDRMQLLTAALSRPQAAGWVHLPEGASGPTGERVACPTCAATHGLAVEFDSHDINIGPSPMRCLAGHVWSEERIPRWAAAQFSQEATDLDAE